MHLSDSSRAEGLFGFRRLSHHLQWLLVLLACGVMRAAEVSPSPHDAAHLVVVRPTDFVGATHAAMKPRENAGAVFGGVAVPVTEPVDANLTVRYAASYTLWIRVGQSGGKTTPLQAELLRAGQPLVSGSINHDSGKIGAGGPEGYRDYREKAPNNTARGVVGDPELTQRHELPSPGSERTDKTVDALAGDLMDEIHAGSGQNWVNTARVEKVNKDFPFYWWKVGHAKLEPGEYSLRVRPHGGAPPAGGEPLLDAAILTTYDGLVYPYAGDINAAKASYIRFRLDKLPADGLDITAGIATHAYPYFNTPAFYLNPPGISVKKAVKHTATGWTRWYCLQDVERAPTLTSGEVTLRLMDPAVLAKGARGATQFATFPHQDAAVRTIAWDEPDGLIVAMQPNFSGNPHMLRTVRDHAREHYEMALSAAGGQPHALSRYPELAISNYGANALGDDYDYIVKSMRLLGFSSVGYPEPLKSRRNYGGVTLQGSSWELSSLPYNEEKSKADYAAYYRDFFKGMDPELWKETNAFQISDEPGEVSRLAMTAPLWRYEATADPASGAWIDRSGGSDLHTRRTDLANCVLEGSIARLDTWVGFRVGIDNAALPKRYAYWLIGTVAPNGMPENLAVGKLGMPGATLAPSYILRPSAVVAKTPTKFKIVYEGNRAALFLNGQLVHEHGDLPVAGGFGITGPAKVVSALRIRPLLKSEHLASDFHTGGNLLNGDGGKNEKPVPDDLDDPDKAPVGPVVPLKQLVEQEWVPAGGIPEAHAGFRKWAAAHGLTPELFGKKSWDDVHMLTVPELVRNVEESRLYYWSRRYSGFLTPRMFSLAAQAVRELTPNKQMTCFVGLSGHSLYFPSEMPLDMFEMANQGYPLQPGISDWMSLGGWRWDSHQAVAYSVAPFNSGARRWAEDGSSAQPVSFPMMHCVWPSTFRAYTMLANQVKTLSFYTFGPLYASTGDHWSESQECYDATSLTGNRAGQVDDILGPGRMRPSRVAMLYAHSTEYWDPHSSFADRRAAFLGLSHEYFQPDLITEDQISAGTLKHYDAVYVLDPYVSADAQHKIADWVKAGGLLWTSADAMTHDEYNQPADGLVALAEIVRQFPPPAKQSETPPTPAAPPPRTVIAPVSGEASFRSHTVPMHGMPSSVTAGGASIRVRAKYASGMPAWLEANVGKGRVVYLGHRAGLAYSSQATRPPGYYDIWAEAGRSVLTLPLVESHISRELVLSEPTIMASPISDDAGTVVVLYNMRPIPRENLVVELREPAKPLSVQTFSGLELNDVPFDYRDGRVVFTLPRLEGGQMVMVRRKPRPIDHRLEETHQRTIEELAAKDWESLSAGAWFAGFHPEWNAADRLAALLTHDHWQVRRSAAEALGRLRATAAADALASAVRVEKDSNAFADELLALAKLHDARTLSLAQMSLTHEDPLFREGAAHAAIIFLSGPNGAGAVEAKTPDAKTTADAKAIADAALADVNLRVRRPGMELAIRLDPARGVDLAIKAFWETGPRATLDRGEWARLIATSESAFAVCMHRDLNQSDDLVLALAQLRSAPELAKAINAHLKTFASAHPQELAAAAIRQESKPLARKLFEQRATLAPELAIYIPHILEHAYDAQLGVVLTDWEAWLASHPDGAK